MGWNASDTRPLSFDDCRVPEANLLGRRGEGFKNFLHILDGGRIGVAAMAVGLAQGALDEAISYAKERRAFGKPIASFQAIQAKIADLSAQIEAARLLTYRAALEKDRGESFTLTAAQAKLITGRLAVRATEEAVQIHGGYGYIEEYPVCRFYRDAKILTIGEGTDEVQQMVIARAARLLALGSSLFSPPWSAAGAIGGDGSGSAGGDLGAAAVLLVDPVVGADRQLVLPGERLSRVDARCAADDFAGVRDPDPPGNLRAIVDRNRHGLAEAAELGDHPSRVAAVSVDEDRLHPGDPRPAEVVDPVVDPASACSSEGSWRAPGGRGSAIASAFEQLAPPRSPGRARASRRAPSSEATWSSPATDSSRRRRRREAAIPRTSLRRLRARRSSRVPSDSIDVPAMGVDLLPQLGDALALRRLGADDRHLPGPGSWARASTPRISRTMVSVIG